MAFDYASLLESGGGGGGGQTAQSRAEANVNYGSSNSRTNDLWPVVALSAVGTLALVLLFLLLRKRN